METKDVEPHSSLDILKRFHTGTLTLSLEEQDDDDEDATISGSNYSTLCCLHLNMPVPGDELAKLKSTQILEAAGEKLDCLKNEFPSLQIIPWKVETLASDTVKQTKLPTDPKEAEIFIFNCNRFFSNKSGFSTSRN